MSLSPLFIPVCHSVFNEHFLIADYCHNNGTLPTIYRQLPNHRSISDYLNYLKYRLLFTDQYFELHSLEIVKKIVLFLEFQKHSLEIVRRIGQFSRISGILSRNRKADQLFSFELRKHYSEIVSWIGYIYNFSNNWNIFIRIVVRPANFLESREYSLKIVKGSASHLEFVEHSFEIIRGSAYVVPYITSKDCQISF